jgi:hypothetical protein
MNVSSEDATIAFIHIGKTGGTTIDTILKPVLSNYREYHHTRNYQPNEKYIVWLRNPITRFCSAFNHSYYAITTDIKSIKEFHLDHCLIPFRMKGAIGKSYVFSEEYDTLMKQFTSANHLAESLSSEDKELQSKAKALMSREEEHLHKGIHWYLHKDYFLHKNNKNILFVGKLESMTEDIIKLADILGVKLDEKMKLRENIYIDKSMKYLSPLAVENIIEWYKDTDYATLKQLLIDGWIDEATYNMYHIYE